MMSKDPLLDKDFLKALDQENQREIFAKIATLTFEEHPIEFITGRVTSGSINVDGQSSTRRSCSITLIAKELNIHDFYWGLNTKIMLFIGLKNNINNNYPDIIWFPQGIFLITSFSTNQTTNNYTISISGRDKMSLLNGDIGGIITSLTADFGKIEEIDAEGNITISSIPLKDIIREVVHEYAREPFENIIIEDLDDVGLELMEYRLDQPMYFLIDDKTNEVSNMFLDISGKEYYYSVNGGVTYTDTNPITNEPAKIGLDYEKFIYDTRTEFFNIQETPYHIKDDKGDTYTVIKCSYGESIGYKETDLTYAGELIGQVNSSITSSCLDKIKNMLGNFEYFYDIDGRFHFRRKKTFIDISWNNLIKEDDSEEIYANSTALTSPLSYSFENANLITSFQNKPNLQDLKNDYSIWGTKVATGGKEYPVHLRYAIDKKPEYYKTFDGRIYCTNTRSYASIQKEVTDQATSLYAETLLKHEKKPLPYGLSDQWWEMKDWANLYKELTGNGYPQGGIGQYTTGYDYLDLENLFPHGRRSWNKNNPVHIFDVKNTENGDLNGPLWETCHNPYCGHEYTQYFVNRSEAEGFTSYIYNPTFPIEVESQINNNIIGKYIKKYHYGCDWREILYQMAKDYLKYEHNANFLGTLAENNADYYPTGYTGYEMYYTDIVSFWRDIYDPEYKYTKHPAYVTKSLYEANPSEYFWFAQADERLAYDDKELYYIKRGFDDYEQVSITEEEFYNNYSNYWYLSQGSQNIPYDSTREYFTKTDNDYNTKKYSAVNVDKYSELNNQIKNSAVVYYVLSEKKYYAYNNSSNRFEILSESDERLVQNPEFGWHYSIIDEPTSVNFWFDFLDPADGSLTAYNVRNVGDRPKSVNDTNVKAIYYRDTPTVIFLDSDISEKEKLKQKKLKPGYTFILLPTYMKPLFVTSTQKKCTKDVLEEWLYQYTNCTESITISALPVYYLEPNTRIFVHDENSGINGEYIINKISYQLTYNGTMSINATKAIDRIY